MAEYFEYLRLMIIAVFADIGEFFAAPWKNVPANFDVYNNYFAQHSPNFGF